MDLDDDLIPRLPVNTETIDFDNWTITYYKSHILKSMCSNNDKCIKDDEGCCDLCTYRFSLELPSLPDMVFHKNLLVLEHKNGARFEFKPIDALQRVYNKKLDLQVACANEWRETR